MRQQRAKLHRLLVATAQLVALVGFLALITAGLSGCGDDYQQIPARGERPIEDVNNSQFHQELVDAASTYLGYGMVNVSPKAAPELCVAPPSEPLLSSSDDDDTHGKKLYYLFSKDIVHYVEQDGSDSPVGQVIVKEAWKSQPAGKALRRFEHPSGNMVVPHMVSNGKELELGEQHNLFMMLKLDPATPETDQGWVYGVVNPRTREIYAAGAVHSCMQCHQDAKHDRLFGPQQ